MPLLYWESPKKASECAGVDSINRAVLNDDTSQIAMLASHCYDARHRPMSARCKEFWRRYTTSSEITALLQWWIHCLAPQNKRFKTTDSMTILEDPVTRSSGNRDGVNFTVTFYDPELPLLFLDRLAAGVLFKHYYAVKAVPSFMLQWEFKRKLAKLDILN